MKQLTLVISDEAISDLTDIWTYIAEDNIERADQFVDLIYTKCATLAETPMMGRDRSDLVLGIRSFPVGNYLLFYRIETDTLQIVRVLSGYRNLEDAF